MTIHVSDNTKAAGDSQPNGEYAEPVSNEEAIMQLADSAIGALDKVIRSLNFQVLANADILPRNGRDKTEIEILKSLSENMIKSPIRLQVSNINHASKFISEIKKKVYLIQKDKER